MRAPRYRFPDPVRSSTRGIAARMVRDGTVAGSPEELEAWISREPDVRESLVAGGYESKFTAHDLFPLLQVFVAQEGGPSPEVEAAPARSGSRWLVAALVALVLVLLVLSLTTDLLSQP